MSTSTSQDLRCPQCAAHVRAGSDWCTLCYADLRPPVPPPAAELPALEPATGPDPEGELGGEPEPAGARPRGRHAKQCRSSDEEVELVAQTLLAELAAAESGDPLGRLASQVDSPGRKVALMAGGAVAVTAVLFLLMLVVGVLL